VPEVVQKAKNQKLFKGLLIGGVLFAVFAVGFGLGSGSLSFTSKQNSQNSSLPANLNFASVDKVYDLLRQNFDGELKETELLEGAKRGLVSAAGDPYTEYLSPQETKEFDEGLNGTFSGIGAELGKEGDAIIIVAPIAGFPAEKAGLKSKDIVAEVDGESTYGKSVSEVVKKIRGPEGTEVTLRVIRGDEDLTFKIKRETITIPSVESKILEGNIGYIKITQFGDDTAALTTKAANDLAAKKVKGVVLDVRGNPGGLLNSAVDISSLWLPPGKTVLEEKRGDTVIKTYQSAGNPVLEGIPTVVLIDGGSASASEIVAGALSDNNAATLLGVTSFGKGSVQSVERLPDGGALKVTIARWFTPNGKNIDKEGIEPKVTVEQPDDSKADAQLEAAQAELKK
jgi:carboxyl-terminal processing protease